MPLNNWNDPLTSLSLLQYLMDEVDRNEDEIGLSSQLIKNCTNNKSCNTIYGKQYSRKHAGVQTIPEIDKVHVPWLLEIETKADALCVELSNFFNTLYHSSRIDSREKHGLLKHAEFGPKKDSTKFNYDKQKFNPSDLAASSTSGNATTSLMLRNMENKIKSLLKSAIELRNSIPVIDDAETEKGTLIQNGDLNNHLVTYSNLLHQKQIKKVALKVPRDNIKMPVLGGRENNKLRKQNSSLGVKGKDNAHIMGKNSSKSAGEKASATTDVSVTRDLRETGAIPKRYKASKELLGRTALQTKASSATQILEKKPVWR